MSKNKQENIKTQQVYTRSQGTQIKHKNVKRVKKMQKNIKQIKINKNRNYNSDIRQSRIKGKGI